MKTIYSFAAFCITWIAAAQNMDRMEYFIDTDPGFGNATTVNFTPQPQIYNYPFAVSIPSNLPAGIHTIGYRTRSSDGLWGQTNFTTFQTADPVTAMQIESVQYFWNQDPGFTAVGSVPIAGQAFPQSIEIPVDLPAGEHILFLRAIDSNGRFSHTNYRIEIQVTPLANPGFENAKLQVYPNPVIDMVNISLTSDAAARVVIYDFSGKKVRDQSIGKTGAIELSDLSSGIYTLFCWTASNTIYKTKLIKK